MDPNANLREQLALVALIQDTDDEGIIIESGECLAELVLALHEWIAKGGFLPTAWQEVS